MFSTGGIFRKRELASDMYDWTKKKRWHTLSKPDDSMNMVDKDLECKQMDMNPMSTNQDKGVSKGNKSQQTNPSTQIAFNNNKGCAVI
jgi:hypothetical protein